MDDVVQINSESDLDTGGISYKLNRSPSYARMAQQEIDNDSDEEQKSPNNAVEAPLMDNQTQRSLSPVEILNDIYEEIVSDEDSEHKEQQAPPKTIIATNPKANPKPPIETETETKTEGETHPITETQHTSNKTPKENTDSNKNKAKTALHLEIMDKVHQNKSVLDTTMSHSERMDNLWSFFNIRIIIQVSLATILALSTFFIEVVIWRVLHISHCTDDMVYLSWNSFKSSLYNMWKYGFCLIIGDIYLLTATIIDHDACCELALYYVPMRKVRWLLVFATMFLAFITSFFICGLNTLLYVMRIAIFWAACIVFYYVMLAKYRHYVTKESWYILWPFAAYVGVVVIIYNLGLGVAWLFRDSVRAFATVYPIYIGFAQFLGMFSMRYYHHFLCLFCKEKYLVSSDYDPNSQHEQTDITSRYICTDDGGNIENYDENDEELVDGRAVEYLWVDEWIYFICGMMIVFTESMRISGLLAVKDDGAGIVISCITALIMEVLQRNNLIWELLYRVIIKKRNPDRCKFDALYYGAKFSWEYVPIALLIVMNITRFGPSDRNTDCFKESLNGIYSLMNEYWWILVVILLFELATDLLCEFINWMLRRYNIIPRDRKLDGARRIILIRLGLWGWAVVFITALQVAQVGYVLDHALYNMLNGDWELVDSWWSFVSRFF